MQMKRQRSILESSVNPFDILSEEIVFIILDYLEGNPLDAKSFSLVCRSFYTIESCHRKILKPLRSEHLGKVLKRYSFVSNIDLSLCPRITDTSLNVISYHGKEMLSSINLSRSMDFTHLGLSNLVMNCRNLVEIDLSNATGLKDLAAAAIAEAKNLERLLLVRCKSITDIGVGCIAVGCKKLKVLSLKWCLGVGDLGVGIVAVKCKDLRCLDLSFLQITNKCLPQILELEHLEDLVLEGCFGLDDEILAEHKQFKSLEKLDVSSCQNVSHVGLFSLASAAPCLRQLIVSYVSCVDITLTDRLRKFSMLQSVKFDGCEVTCSVLKSIGNWCASLRELSLSKCVGVMDEGLSFLVNKHKDLRKLDLTCCRKITRVSLSHIMSSCTSLTSLKMESCTLVSADAFVLMGQQCPYLEELDLTDNEIDDEGLKSISRCSHLASLKLGICLNITDEGLIHVGKGCSKLRELDLYRSAGLTDSGVLAVSRGCPELEIVNMAYCELITDRSLMSLSKCSKLHTLEIRGCTLITSSGLAAIAEGCRQLAKLDVKKCPNIDDSGMLPYARLSQNLKQVNLSYTSVTDMGLLSLACISCLQSLTVLHVEGLTPTGIAAALLACGGLTKVKLHTSFKSLLPQRLFEHLEARGYSFQWRDKVFEVELDPKCWKLQFDDME
ncbi:F-box/LRR-repeat protein 3 [Dorcoceras hygrometricum]|uniref:F-box/LRR-repeat protein 3 n=1 Tax=Dorcoceras hygrometricum TaxID=472368 RepID=A0A2Z7A8G4_9LAMI|nr:F-box/LRR-repeat protein 3 [Dorcoceras hygrometricum]